ncbi:Sporulation related domain-containing protein [Tranquillimonas rosea]|uniref:Sporulation related domain-containing protein n=1 Tax=Tranquillimonas rosea TaxID=641238 RepID=A0A1H9TJY4_9RHOB|nr:SPOR domain-containing protein [Tranquillimonas rosea]SER97189.1 Sporulation related domain-containing protein [Tranquillimonas rosea]
MTDYSMDPPGPEGHEAGFGVGRAVQWVGGLASIALIAGLGVWGYKLILRDVSGVPVVRALEGPARVAPDDPGGERADHQGLAVNAVAAEGNSERLADRLTLAPDPMNLDEEDRPVAELADDTEPAAEPAADTPAETRPDTVMAEAEPVEDKKPETPEEVALAIAKKLSQGAKPLDPPEESTRQLAEMDSEGVRISPRPSPRPAVAVSRDVQDVTQVAARPAAPVANEVAVSEIAPGTRLVQLGAFESAEVAREQWQVIGGRFEEFFDDKKRVVQKAESGGQTFYRLRATGFADLADARRFCAALVAERADCIPVVAR